MLCGNCQVILGRAIELQADDWGVLHDELLSFHESIFTGCLLCRQLWYAIEKRHQKDKDNKAIYTNADKMPIPEDFPTFQIQAQKFRSMINRSSPKSELKLPKNNQQSDVFTYKVAGSINGTGMHLSICSEYFQLETEFSLNLDHDNGLLGLPGGHDFQVQGTSTSAMPQMWIYWLRNCLEFHPLCRSPTTSASFTPTRLIELAPNDTAGMGITWRVVVFNSTDSIKYVTLSHCWGTSEHIKLTRASFPALCNQFHPMDLLPKTYQQALEIALTLGFHYIWIDSLCILQDDLDDWRKQSSMMGAIYSNTSCNIAASFAEDGNQGCYNKRDPTIVSPTTLLCGSGQSQTTQYSVSKFDLYHNHTIDSPLSTRGWVVQERCLASKQLSFGEHQVFWECAQLSACEQFPRALPERLWQGDLVAPPAAKPTLALSDEFELRQMWCSLVEHYSFCTLSKESDKTVAFAGLASEYQKRTRDRYLAGLWERDFHKQLCWIWNHVWEVPGYEYVCSRTRQYQGPTWSWMSIDGPVGIDSNYYRHAGQYACFLRLLDTRIQSNDPANLHSFTSCEIKVQAVAFYISILPSGDDCVIDIESKIRIRMSGQDINVESEELFFDEKIPVEKRSAYPKRWDQIQESRRSDMLLVLVTSDLSFGSFLDGIFLQKIMTPARDLKFMRMGVVHFECRELLDILATRLALTSDAQLAGNIDLNDPRISDLVHTVNII